MSQDNFADIIPYGDLGIIALESSRAIGEKVDNYVSSWRNESRNDEESIHFTSYKKDSYLIDAVCPRFGSGESKGLLNESVRGKDLYILLDVCNHSLTYKVCGQVNHMSPDDHYQDLKRIIAAVSGKARRITVIMPFLYEGRQHKRSTRESLDCALALQELTGTEVTDSLQKFFVCRINAAFTLNRLYDNGIGFIVNVILYTIQIVVIGKMNAGNKRSKRRTVFFCSCYGQRPHTSSMKCFIHRNDFVTFFMSLHDRIFSCLELPVRQSAILSAKLMASRLACMFLKCPTVAQQKQPASRKAMSSQRSMMPKYLRSSRYRIR